MTFHPMANGNNHAEIAKINHATYFSFALSLNYPEFPDG